MAYLAAPRLGLPELTSVRRLREAGVKGMKWGEHKAVLHKHGFRRTGSSGPGRALWSNGKGNAVELGQQGSGPGKSYWMCSHGPNTASGLTATQLEKHLSAH